MSDGKTCEHCLIGITCYSLYGKFKVYECEKGERYMQQDLIAGFIEPCYGYHCGTGKRGETWKPKYKRIPTSQMRKSESCIQDEEEESESRRKDADSLKKQALELLLKAKELENNNIYI